MPPYYIDASVLLENIQWDIFDILTSEDIADVHSQNMTHSYAHS